MPPPKILLRMGCGTSLDSGDLDKMTVVVFGATGMIGGAVIQAFLKSGHKVKVKAVTRTPTSDAAHQLAEDGAILATADLNDVRSLERALSGASCVFLTTHYWDHMNRDKEIHQGMNAIDACVQTGVSHVIFLGAGNSRRITGKDCGYLDAKSAIEEYIMERSQGPGHMFNYTILRLPLLYESLLTVFKPHCLKPDIFALALPLEDTNVDCMSVRDFGKCVYNIVVRPKPHNKKILHLSCDKLTPKEMAESLTRHIHHKKFVCPQIRVKDYERFNFKGAKDLAALFEYYQSGAHEGDLKLTKKLSGHSHSFDKWVHENVDKFESVLKDET